MRWFPRRPRRCGAGLAIPVAALAAVNVVPHGTAEPVDLSELPGVVAYQTSSGLEVAGPASAIDTGTPVLLAENPDLGVPDEVDDSNLD